MAAQEGEDYKNFHMRVPKETWLFLKKRAMLCECSMTDVIVELLEGSRKRLKNILTDKDTLV